MMLAASPAVAERIHVSRDSFIVKQVVFVCLASVIVVSVSLLTPRQVRRLALVGCGISILLTGLDHRARRRHQGPRGAGSTCRA